MSKECAQRIALVWCATSACTFSLTFGYTLCHFSKWDLWVLSLFVGTLGSGLYCLRQALKGLLS